MNWILKDSFFLSRFDYQGRLISVLVDGGSCFARLLALTCRGMISGLNSADFFQFGGGGLVP